MARAGVIGCGLMGTACTRRLTQAGFDVVAYDVDEEKRNAIVGAGAKAAATIADVVKACDATVLAVFDTGQVEEVIEGPGGVLEAMGRISGPRILICTSTCDPDRLAALAARIRPRDVHLLEVPISGTSRQVAEGAGVGLVGGDRSVADRAAAVLDAICPRRHFLGEVGSGSRAKLAVNLILGLNRAAIAEGLVFAERLGLDRSAFLDVARGSAAYSQVMDIKGPLMARREYKSPQSRVDQSLKDFRLMLAQARESGQELPFASLYAQLLEDCIRHGEAEWDNAVIAEAIARRHRS
jgi:3-hydroxyisobutyrate dehydrogenase-like beta-hydroxyacid dehydrogenase